MKKLYALTIGLLGLSAIGVAQCAITSGPTITPNGPTINVTATGTGATTPTYVWDWGDQSNPGISQSDSHTYGSAGTYTVCLTYVDQSNPFTCFDTACVTITVNVVGIAETSFGSGTISATPNPFGATANFTVDLTKNSDVEISVYDMNGKLVEKVQDGEMAAGVSTIAWTPTDLAEGVYFIQMNIDGQIQTRKMVHTSGN